MSGISVMMCRYVVVKRELVGTTLPESCLLFSGGSEEGLGGRRRWGLRNIYEMSLQKNHVTIFFFFFFDLFKSRSSHTAALCPCLQTLLIQGRPLAVEKQHFRVDQRERKKQGRDLGVGFHEHVWVWM